MRDSISSRRFAVRLAAVFVLAFGGLVSAAGCDSTDSGGAGCVPGNGGFGDRCCAASDCKGGTTCRTGQCTKQCGDAGVCDVKAPDGGTVACSADGYCVPPPLPVSASGDSHGW